MVKRRPRGTVYVDFLQNILGKTLAIAYSARASDYAGVSTPLTWKEVDGRIDPRDFTIRTAPARFASVGDLWKAGLRAAKPADPRNGVREIPALERAVVPVVDILLVVFLVLGDLVKNSSSSVARPRSSSSLSERTIGSSSRFL